MGLRQKLVLFLVVAATVPVVVVGVITATKGQSVVKKVVGDSSLEFARLAMVRINGYLHVLSETVRSWAGDERVAELDNDERRDDLSSYLRYLNEMNPQFFHILVADLRGMVVAASVAELVGRDISTLPVFQGALRYPLHLEDAHFSELAGGHALDFGVPIGMAGERSAPRGVLIASLKWSEVSKMIVSLRIRGKKQDEVNHLMLTNRDGLVISCSDSNKMFASNLTDLGMSSSRLAQQDEEGYLLETSPHGLASFSTYTYSKPYGDLPDLGWHLILLQDPDELFGYTSTLWRTVVLTLLVAIGLIVLLAIPSARRLTRPILKVAAAAEALGKGDLKTRVSVAATDEIGQLATSFNKMATRLSESTESLREQEIKLRSIVNALPSGLTIQDRNYEIIYQNEMLRDTFGGLGGKCYRVYEGRDEVCSGCPMRLAFADGKSHSSFRTVTMPSGETGYWENVASPIRDADGRIVSCLEIASDVTERMTLEAHMHHAAKLESIGTLAGGVAHDINNTLSVIMAYASLFYDELEGEYRNDAMEMLKACRRGRDMTRNLLGFSRKEEVHREIFSLSSVATDVRNLLMRTIPKTISIRLEIDPDLAAADGDRSQIHTVLMNLCVNAVDAMSGKGALAITARNVRCDETDLAKLDIEPGDYLCLEVSDTGHGMDERTLARAFDPFFTTKPSGKGTGLGLSMVHGTVASHGGAASIESEPGVGTTVRVYLPTVAATSDDTKSTGHDRSGVIPGKGTVLIVDDEEAFRRVTKKMLEKLGYDTLVACDGQEALELFKKESNTVSLIILDLNMPVLNGADTLPELVKLNSSIRVLITSGHVEEARALVTAGVAGFLRKPFELEQLAQELAKLTA